MECFSTAADTSKRAKAAEEFEIFMVKSNESQTEQSTVNTTEYDIYGLQKNEERELRMGFVQRVRTAGSQGSLGLHVELHFESITWRRLGEMHSLSRESSMAIE